MSQDKGLVGRIVGSMIRRSVRSRFHNVYWRSRQEPVRPPVIFYANHHGWMDGYLMYHLVSKLGVQCIDWIEEFDAFPLFARVGGVRFAKGDAYGRARAIRQTIREMNGGMSLVLFPEGRLHRPSGLLPFGRSLEFVANKVRGVSLNPVAIHYELSMHERPEAWLDIGQAHAYESLQNCEFRLAEQLEKLRSSVVSEEPFAVLATGTADVNERWDIRRARKH